jgi:flagellar basal-body rod protein FlgC
MSLLGSFDIGTTGLVAQSVRLNLIASNVANADSAVSADGQPFRARLAVFQAMDRSGSNRPAKGVSVTRIVESDAAPRLEYRPGHPLANDKGYVVMSNVNVAEQMVDMVSASRAYQLNIELMNTARQLVLKTLDIGK